MANTDFASSSSQQFHIVRLVAASDAAAFIAALSRVLASPRGEAYRSQQPAPEVWARFAKDSSVEVYLNTTAQAAAATAFAPMPAGDITTLPSDAIPVIVGNAAKAMASDQVRRLLSNVPPA